ncbi:MAG TPA: hypothetical protein VFJ82_26645 [Longimicrobium sp.]|nr:hypothetical protein [Longimicrobium sp.]
MKRYPGQVWFLPPELEEGGDGKRRRHVLLTTCEEGHAGVFSYASTRPAEARSGAAYLFVDPAASPDRGTGFSKPTYVYASRLVAATPGTSSRLVGRIVHELPRLRAMLVRALGLGTGTDVGCGKAARSWRGRIVTLSAARREAGGYGFGIVVTEADYSRRRRYQIIVPMDDARVLEREPEDLVVSQRAWVHQVGPGIDTVAIGVVDVHSMFHPLDIAAWTGAVVDEETLAEIEARLRVLFEL